MEEFGQEWVDATYTMSSYKPYKDDDLDIALAKLLKERGSTKIPIIRIKPGQYLIGSQVKSLSLKVDAILVRIGGGFSPCINFLNNNENLEHSNLAQLMSTKQMTCNEVILDHLSKIHAHVNVIQKFRVENGLV